jgi:hypothetical protein
LKPLLLSVFLVLAAVSAQAEDLVVIRSTTPKVAVGEVVPSGAPLAIPGDAEVVLLGVTGRVVRLAGPFSGVPPFGEGATPPRDELIKNLRTLLTSNQVIEVRGLETTPSRPARATRNDLFAVDVGSAGTQCLADDAPANLIRDPAATGIVMVRPKTGGGTATINWPSGAARVPWPQTSPLASGATYLLFRPAVQGSTSTINVLHWSAVESDIDTVALLAQHDCADQARFLLGLMADQR